VILASRLNSGETRLRLNPDGKVFPVSEEIRSKLKSPLGELVADEGVTKAGILSRITALAKQAIVVSIGDRTTERLVEFSIPHNLEILDHIEKRSSRGEIVFAGSERFHAKNDPGTISLEALKVLSKSLELVENDRKVLIRIDVQGEEDLLTLPVLAFFPPETVVLYGQPNEGMVIVRAKGEPRIKSWDILAELGIRSL
jgi:GTP-dependent dephospho-CoA kinase